MCKTNAGALPAEARPAECSAWSALDAVFRREKRTNHVFSPISTGACGQVLADVFGCFSCPLVSMYATAIPRFSTGGGVKFLRHPHVTGVVWPRFNASVSLLKKARKNDWACCHACTVSMVHGTSRSEKATLKLTLKLPSIYHPTVLDQITWQVLLTVLNKWSCWTQSGSQQRLRCEVDEQHPFCRLFFLGTMPATWSSVHLNISAESHDGTHGKSE